MNRLILLLNRHRWFTVITGSCYFISTVLLHEEVSRISIWFQTKLTTPVYNDVLAIIGLAMISLFAFFILNRIREGEDRKFKLLYLVLTLALITVSFKTLLTINAEYVHFFQYAILAVPIFAITMKYGETVFWVTLLGTLDEAYQYFILYPDFRYFDINDVILNLLGGGIGVILIFTTLKGQVFQEFLSLRGRGRMERSRVMIISVVLIAGLLISYVTGYLQLYPDPESSGNSILLNRGPAPSSFWKRFDWGKTLHVLHPVEGMMIAGLLVGFYSLIDYRIRKRM